MKTGNTPSTGGGAVVGDDASMEPGHEDREYNQQGPGRPHPPPSLNGARS